jgi:hypothetical protein
MGFYPFNKIYGKENIKRTIGVALKII